MRGLLLVLVLVSSALAGCVDDKATCKTSKNCVVGEMCLPSPRSANMWCAYADTTCPSGYHWGLHAGDNLDALCVAGVVADAGPSPDAP
jgi:hypothetical protein